MAERRPSALDLDPIEVTVKYLYYLAIAFAVYVVLWFFGRNWMVMTFDDLWQSGANYAEAFKTVWFFFAWGVAINTLVGLKCIIQREPQERDPVTMASRGLWISINAGFFEELIYRCFLFLNAMVFLRLLNAVSYGFVEWFYSTWLIPLANWATFGALEQQLVYSGWLLGASIISANGNFRSIHSYQGLFGYVFSWFGGMLLFWVMFNYGLWCAILVHVVYDALVFLTAAFFTALQPKPKYNLLWR